MHPFQVTPGAAASRRACRRPSTRRTRRPRARRSLCPSRALWLTRSPSGSRLCVLLLLPLPALLSVADLLLLVPLADQVARFVAAPDLLGRVALAARQPLARRADGPARARHGPGRLRVGHCPCRVGRGARGERARLGLPRRDGQAEGPRLRLQGRCVSLLPSLFFSTFTRRRASGS